MKFSTPILFLIFNRPDHAQRVLQRIREVKPVKLYIAADGPRINHAQDITACASTRQRVIEMIDWECKLTTLFREDNLGCGHAVASAISWFFEHEEQGIILEDDCVPNPSFFNFSEQLLNFYKDDYQVMHIGGSCYPPRNIFGKESYYFSKYAHCWGWSTWRRSWKLFDNQMSDLDLFYKKSESLSLDEAETSYWLKIFREAQNRKDIWDYHWNYSIWKNGGACIHPTRNYIKNIGFDAHASHTSTEIDAYKKVRHEDSFKMMVHPERKEINDKADKFVYYNYYVPRKKTIMERAFSRIVNVLKSLIPIYCKENK